MSVTAPRAPVALMVFNRPALTRRVFGAIAAARPPRLLVVGDGPRADHPEDEQLVAQTRAVIDLVDWPCEVLTEFASENLGCKERIASGLDWVFEQSETAIVLEDDCLPDASFFPFCEQLLERYRDDARVHMVTGTNLLPAAPVTEASYYFSRWFHIWGWASWARAWAHYDPAMRRWPELRETGWLEEAAGGPDEAAVVRPMFEGAYDGTVGTWDFQLVFSGWLRGAMAAKPSTNLVTNIGYGEQASHEREPDHPAANLPARSIAFPLRHPTEVKVDALADRAEFEAVNPHARPRHLVLGAAIGLSEEQVRPFLRSLQKSGYRGDTVLFVDRSLARTLAGEADAQRLTLIRARQWLPFKLGLLKRRGIMRLIWRPLQLLLWGALRSTVAVPLPAELKSRLQLAAAAVVYTPMDTRFLRYERFLAQHRYERVLITDVRDVLFQADPFRGLPEHGLAVSLETPSYTIETEAHNALWVNRAYGARMLERIGSQRVSCVGVTYGDRDSIVRYLGLIRAELLAMHPDAAGIGGADTAIHNVLVWTGRLGEVDLLEPLGGPVATLNAIPDDEVRLSESGRLRNRDGSEPSVLHQYDRIPAIRDRLRQTLAS